MDLTFRVEVDLVDGEWTAAVHLVDETGRGQAVWLSPSTEEWARVRSVSEARDQARDDFAKRLGEMLA